MSSGYVRYINKVIIKFVAPPQVSQTAQYPKKLDNDVQAIQAIQIFFSFKNKLKISSSH